jgi:hypothetical protein
MSVGAPIWFPVQQRMIKSQMRILPLLRLKRRQLLEWVWVSNEIFSIDSETLLWANAWAPASAAACHEGRGLGIRESKADRWQFVKSWININYISSVSREKGRMCSSVPLTTKVVSMPKKERAKQGPHPKPDASRGGEMSLYWKTAECQIITGGHLLVAVQYINLITSRILEGVNHRPQKTRPKLLIIWYKNDRGTHEPLLQIPSMM